MNSTRKNDQRIGKFQEATRAFVSHVSQLEREIAENYHGPTYGPDCIERFWCVEFESLYSQLRNYLKPVMRQRLCFPPQGTHYCSNAFQSESATSALMHFLNPAEALYGEAGILQDPTYLQLKSEMLEELSEVDARLSDTRKFQPSKRARKISELIELRSFIFDHHLPEGGRPNLEVLESTDIEEAFNWKQSTVSKRMKVLFRNRIGGGMRAYQKIFGADMDAKGIRSKLDDGSLAVDEIWEDRVPNEDDDPDEGAAVA